MCYRFENYVEVEGALVNKSKLRIGERHNRLKQFAEKYSFVHTNGFAHEALPVYTIQNPDKPQWYKWGLIPHWVKAKDKDGKALTARQNAMETWSNTLNAKSETIFKLPSFSPYIKSRRCLIPATAFFEWHHKNAKEKFPYRIMVKDYEEADSTRTFHFGGLYSTWVDPDNGETFNTFSIVTVPANKKMEFIHNSKKRMPLILHSYDEEKWLDPKMGEKELTELMLPYPDEYLTAYTIRKKITNTKEDANVPETLNAEGYDGIPETL